MAEEEKKVKEKKPNKVKTFFKDFGKFLSKGNVIDLAVAVIIGGAFSKIVNSLVSGLFMPLLSAVIGKNSIEELVWKATSTLTIGYGLILQAIIEFIIFGLCLFLIVKLIMNSKDQFARLQKKLIKQGKIEEAEAVAQTAPVEPPESLEQIMKDIRELLKATAIKEGVIPEEVAAEVKAVTEETK